MKIDTAGFSLPKTQAILDPEGVFLFLEKLYLSRYLRVRIQNHLQIEGIHMENHGI